MATRVGRRAFVGAALAWAEAGRTWGRDGGAGLSDAFLARLAERMKADTVPGASRTWRA